MNEARQASRASFKAVSLPASLLLFFAFIPRLCPFPSYGFLQHPATRREASDEEKVLGIGAQHIDRQQAGTVVQMDLTSCSRHDVDIARASAWLHRVAVQNLLHGHAREQILVQSDEIMTAAGGAELE